MQKLTKLMNVYETLRHLSKFSCRIFKTFPDSLQLLVNSKRSGFKGVRYPEEGAHVDGSTPVLMVTVSWQENKINQTSHSPKVKIYYRPMP